MASPPVLWQIETDPVFAGTKLIAEAWDAGGLYQVGSFVGDRWREWNGRFRDDLRDFSRGRSAASLGCPTVCCWPARTCTAGAARRSTTASTSSPRTTGSPSTTWSAMTANTMRPTARATGTAATGSVHGITGWRAPPTTRTSNGLRLRVIKSLLATMLVSVGCRMLDELLPVNPTTVVVLKDSNPVLMPWIDKANAGLEVWNQGSEDGHVVADLLFGAVNPSGKVPTSYLRSADDTLYAGRPERYPGTDEGSGYPVIRYSEGLQIGYRWYQAQHIEPLFGFGFGLSYTTFEVSDVSVNAPDGARAPVTVTASVTNTGPVAGAEVLQVYLGIPVDGQPPKRLVGFQKVFLQPGESRPVSITVDPASTNHPFAVWDYCSQQFVTKPGNYTVYVGTSADDTPHTTTLSVAKGSV